MKTKTPRTYIIAFALMSLCVSVFGQKQPEAILLDEFSRTSCGDVMVRQDALFYELNKDPGTVGYAVIFADPKHLSEARVREMTIRGHTESRQFDESRFVIVRASGKGGTYVQFWKVPRGAELPEFQPADWDFKLGPESKPFIFNSSERDFGPCPIGPQFKIYSDYLKANPSAHGHIVIWARTTKEFQEEKGRIHRDLLTEYDIPSSRIRFFFRRHLSPNLNWEYWVVPRRKN